MTRVAGQSGFNFTRDVTAKRHHAPTISQAERRFLATEYRPLEGRHALDEQACRHPAHDTADGWIAAVACGWCGGTGVFPDLGVPDFDIQW